MLTKEQLEQAEIIINNMGGCGVTLANDLIAMVRTLQQQNAQMKEAFAKLDAVYDFGTPLEDGVSYSFVDVEEANEVQREVKDVFDNIQGGSHDPHE